MNKSLVFAITAWFIACFALGMLAENIIHEHEQPIFDIELKKQWMLCGESWETVESENGIEFSLEAKLSGCELMIDELNITFCEDCEKI